MIERSNLHLVKESNRAGSNKNMPIGDRERFMPGFLRSIETHFLQIPTFIQLRYTDPAFSYFFFFNCGIYFPGSLKKTEKNVEMRSKNYFNLRSKLWLVQYIVSGVGRGSGRGKESC